MSIPLEAGVVTIAHGNSDRNKQIYMAAEAIWGIKANDLPQAKFDELKTVLEGHLERQYGPYSVQGFGNVFLISMDPIILEPSYKKRPCSLGTCMVTNAASKCARCRKAMYCCREHQAADWPRHKVECIAKK